MGRSSPPRPPIRVNALASTTVPPLSTIDPGVHAYVDQNGKERFAVFAPVAGSTWGVLVTHPSPAAYAPNQMMVTRSIAAVAAAALVTLALGALAAELLARRCASASRQKHSPMEDFSPRELVQTGKQRDADSARR